MSRDPLSGVIKWAWFFGGGIILALVITIVKTEMGLYQ